MGTEGFLPYGRQTIDEDDIEAVSAVLRGAYLTTGPAVEAFEEALAQRMEAKHVVAVSNGTAALHAACAAAGLGPGDSVAVPATSFVATANCCIYVGATPVFIDVDPATGLMSMDSLREHAREDFKAVIPVHLTGSPLDLESLDAWARETGATVIEDAAHALGARWDNEPIGNTRHSSMATFSFHPVKHIATGEGGCIATNDDGTAAALRTFRSHGIARSHFKEPSHGMWYYEQQSLGYNYRITDIQCALGLSQIRKLDRFLAQRRALARRYDDLFDAVEWIQPVGSGETRSESAYHLYSVLIDFESLGRTRQEIMQSLRDEDIGTQVHYIPIPAHPYYRSLGYGTQSLPGACQYYERTLSLPLFPGMTISDVDRVVAALFNAA
jgi:perosamine synthetase